MTQTCAFHLFFFCCRQRRYCLLWNSCVTQSEVLHCCFLLSFFFFWMYTFGVCSYIYSSPACFSLSPLPLHPLFRHLDDSILLKNSNNNNKRGKKKQIVCHDACCAGKKKKVDGKGNNVVFGYAEMRCARCWTAIATVVLPSSFIIVIHGDSKTQEKGVK